MRTSLPLEHKFCEVCGEVIKRKRRPSGQLERRDQYAARSTCGHTCSGLKRRKRACVVCGQTHPTRMDARVQVCDSAMCFAIMTLHPALSDPERTNHPSKLTKKKVKAGRGGVSNRFLLKEIRTKATPLPGKQQNVIVVLAERLRIDPSTLKIDGALKLTRDTRGIDGCQDDVWSYLSRKSTLIKIQNKSHTGAGLTLELPEGMTVTEVFRTSMLNESGYEDLCDIFYAWRCPCSYRHTVEYPKLTDLPQVPGWHHACPRCGAAPLEVKRVKEIK